MLKRKLAGLVVAGLLLGAGAVNAGDVFPSSANEDASLNWYQGDIPRVRIESNTGAAESVFPSAANEDASSLRYQGYISRPSLRAVATRSTDSVFPASVND